jgi:hypothetical protein
MITMQSTSFITGKMEMDHPVPATQFPFLFLCRDANGQFYMRDVEEYFGIGLHFFL